MAFVLVLVRPRPNKAVDVLRGDDISNEVIPICLNHWISVPGLFLISAQARRVTVLGPVTLVTLVTTFSFPTVRNAPRTGSWRQASALATGTAAFHSGQSPKDRVIEAARVRYSGGNLILMATAVFARHDTV